MVTPYLPFDWTSREVMIKRATAQDGGRWSGLRDAVLLSVALSAVFPVFLSVLLCVVGFNKNLVGIAFEVHIAADADVILENKVSVDIAESEADGLGEIALEAAFSVVLFQSYLPQQYTSFLNVIVSLIRKLAAISQSLAQYDGTQSAGDLLKN